MNSINKDYYRITLHVNFVGVIIILNTVLVDDEYNSLQRLKQMVEKNSNLKIISLYQDSEKFLEEIDDYLNELNIVFLDIEMPGIKGLELAEIIISKNEDIEIIFVTAYNEYAVEAFEINALDYLLKPISKKRFKKTVSRIKSVLDEKNEKEKKKLIINTFGQIKFKDSSSNKLDLKWQTAKAEELFYYLLRYEGEFTAKDKIIDNLWPESSVDRARDILYTTIYNLRKTFKQLGFSRIVLSKRGFYKINLNNIKLDTVEFKTLIRKYNQKELKAERLLKKLESLYQGDYLADKSYNWLHAYRINLKNMYKSVLDKVSTEFRKNNKQKLYKKSLKIMTEIDPLDEKNFKKLIKVYKKEGKKVSAQRWYKKLENNLWRELKIKPDFKISNC